MNFNEQINYIIEKASLLANSNLSDSEIATFLGDYLTEDIANDWIPGDIPLLEEMQSLGIIDCHIVNLYREIMLNFESVSNVHQMLDNSIWTLHSLNTHPFWMKQRTLAIELLEKLKANHQK